MSVKLSSAIQSASALSFQFFKSPLSQRFSGFFPVLVSTFAKLFCRKGLATHIALIEILVIYVFSVISVVFFVLLPIVGRENNPLLCNSFLQTENKNSS